MMWSLIAILVIFFGVCLFMVIVQRRRMLRDRDWVRVHLTLTQRFQNACKLVPNWLPIFGIKFQHDLDQKVAANLDIFFIFQHRAGDQKLQYFPCCRYFLLYSASKNVCTLVPNWLPTFGPKFQHRLDQKVAAYLDTCFILQHRAGDQK